MEYRKIIFTGSNGLLGSEMKKALPNMCFTTRDDFDVTDYEQMDRFIRAGDFVAIVHAAAFTSPPAVESKPAKALQANIIGAANVVRLCIEHNLKLIYISTDYVFRGDKGNYKEEDLLSPVNKYAWSKLGGECAVRLYDNSLIIRTSFGPNIFPYDKAFVDQWTTRLSVYEAAKKIAGLLGKDIRGVVHVGGRRQTVYEYAESLDPQREIGKLSIHDVSFKVPADTSLDCNLYEEMMRQGGKER